MVAATLREMAKGGMHDQLGGGFHRYSVDERWFVPHFEKMLYDQAQLAVSYLEAFQITGDAAYAATARGILDYVLRDMRDPGGAFYSAEDADSVIDPAHPEEKGEGAFYIWTQSEIAAVVGPARGRMVLLPLRRRAGRQRRATIRTRSSPARISCTRRIRSKRRRVNSAHRRRGPDCHRPSRGQAAGESAARACARTSTTKS